MTAKEKAKELIEKLTLSSNAQDGSWMCEDLAKRCALIACDEILKSFGTTTGGQSFYVGYNAIQFYQEVKREIEKL